MPLIKDIFFDLDRTLWDFEKNAEITMKTIFSDLNLENHIESYEVFFEAYRKINLGYWQDYREGKVSKEKLKAYRFIDTLQLFGIHDTSIGETFGKRFVDESPYQTHLLPFAIELLEELQKESYHLHIITNGFVEVQHTKLKTCGIDKYFEQVLCSEEVGVNKPNPKVFYEALQRTKADISSSIMIGDDLICDIGGAENIGMKAILYDPQNKHEETMNRVDSLQEIPEAILHL